MSNQVIIPKTTKLNADNIVVTPSSDNEGLNYVYLNDGYANNGAGVYLKQSDGTYIYVGGSSSNTYLSLFNRFDVVPNTAGAENTLYTNNIPANTFFNVGDRINFEYDINLAATANNKTLKIYIGANTIFTSDAIKALIQPASGLAILKGYAILTAAGTLRTVVSISAVAGDVSYSESENQINNNAGYVTTDLIAIKITAIALGAADLVAEGGLCNKVKSA